MALSVKAQEKLDFMNGYEVLSLKYEGCVAIKKDKVISRGEVIDTLNTNAKVNSIYRELLDNEGY
jgi:hypothetical protein